MTNFKKFFISILLLSFGAIFMNDLMAYTNEVRQSGSSYVWRVNNVDQGTTTNLAVAIMNTMGANRDIDILVSGTLTQTINVSAAGVRLHCHGNTFTCNFTGSGIINNGNNGFEIYDLTLRNVVGGYGIRSSAASNLRFVNVRTIDIGWIGMRIDSRNSNPWDYTIYNLYMKDCHFENCGSHGLETYSIDGMILEGTMTARNCGECGVLFNQTRNGTVATVNSYNCNWGGGYAGLRYANACNNIITNKLIADRCGRGFFIVQSGPTVNCHLNNAEIRECSGLGIWIENGTNCSVKAGCCESPVSVSGSGSYANVSSSCSSGTTYYQLRNRGTNLYLDGMGRTSNGSDVGQYANTTHVNSQWTLESAGSYYKLKNRGTGLYLDGMGRTVNGEACGQWANSSSYNQQWERISISGYYQFKNRATGLFLDGMGRTVNGDACGQWGNTTHVNSQWSMTSIKSTGAMISDNNKDLQIYPNPAVGGKFTIDLSGMEMEGHVNVEVYSFNGSQIFGETYQGTDKIELDLPLNSGIYLVRVKNYDRFLTKKLTVQ